MSLELPQEPYDAQLHEHGLRALERLSQAAGVSFDRIRAGRALGESMRVIEGNDPLVWSQRLVDVGESLHLRISSLEAPISEVLHLVGEGIPAVTCYRSSDGALRWIVLLKVKGRKIQIEQLDEGSKAHWISVGQLRRTLELTSARDSARWSIGQQALPCERPHDIQVFEHGDHHTNEHSHISPLRRLTSLMRPEASDLWVVLLFSGVVGILTLGTPIAVEALVNTVAFGRYFQPVIVLAILLFTVLAFAAAIRGLLAYVVEILQRRLFVRVVEDLAYRLPRVRLDAMDGHHGPELVNRFLEVVTLQKVTSSLLLEGVSLVLQTFIGMAVLAFYHPFLLGFDIVLLACILFIIFGLGRGAVATSIRESRAKYAIVAWLQELARHPTAFRMHGGNRFALDRADQLTVEYLEARRLHFRVLMRQILFALGLQAIAATVLLGLGGWLVIQGQLTLGQLVAAELIVTVIVGSFAKLGKHMEGFYDLLASMDKLGHLFDLPTEDQRKLFHLRESGAASLTVRDLGYHHHSSSYELSEISFQLASGESLAITGPDGAGKSVLIELLSGIRRPSSGHVELDGIDLRELRPDSLREHIALARSAEIFHGTIDENVHMNRPNISARDVRQALAAVGLLDDLLKLPQGLDTPLQTNGTPLSSGQTHRLALARAIVGRPRLLLIDGSFDAIADEVLDGILDKLISPDAPWTVVVATGRTEVARRCQRKLQLPIEAIVSDVV